MDLESPGGTISPAAPRFRGKALPHGLLAGPRPGRGLRRRVRGRRPGSLVRFILVTLAGLAAEPGEAGEQPGQVRRVSPAVHPAVAQAGGPAQRGVRVTADEHRDRLGGHRRDLDGGHGEALALELEVASPGQPAQDRDRLLQPAPAAGPVDAEHVVVLAPRAGADAQGQPVAGEHRRRGRLLGQQHRVADRRLHDERGEPQPAGHRAERGDQRERLEERLVLQELAAAVGVVRVGAGGVQRVADAVRYHHRVVAGLLGGAGQRRVERRVGHRLRVAEPHCASWTGPAGPGLLDRASRTGRACSGSPILRQK